MIAKLLTDPAINFWVTNRIPRRLATRLMGWLSRVEHPTLCSLSLALWQRFSGDLHLHEAKHSTFNSIHDCFVRELRDGARPIARDPQTLVSPCDGIVGACGRIDGHELIQAKGHRYTLDDLLIDPRLVLRHWHGSYVTLRLTSTMYHRFHAPDAGAIEEVIYVAGDVWNVNPPALERVSGLFCANERAILPLRLGSGGSVTLVPVAAVLVASIHLNFLDVLLNLRYRGPNRLFCSTAFERGEELGYFHHGSTIIVLTSADVVLCDHVREGTIVRMGERLLRRMTSTG